MTIETFAVHLLVGFPIAIIIGNATEWVMHKYVLHGLGKNKDSFWAFHWHAHHNLVRKQRGYDPDYEHPLRGWNGQTKEALALLLAVIALAPTIATVPGFFIGSVYTAINYYVKHRKSHLDPEWARANLPWHYDHHLGVDQDKNWCVTRPWFDWVMGTRVPYVGTEREARDIERARRREAGEHDVIAAAAPHTERPAVAVEVMAEPATAA